MDNQPPMMTKELESAMEDIRQIRGVFDKVRMDHPFRSILRPYFRFTLWMVPVIVVYGIIAQLYYEAKLPNVFGLSRTAILWYLLGAMVLSSSVIKFAVFAHTARQTRISIRRFFTRFFIEDQYYRVYFSVIGLTIAGSVAIWHAGRPDQIVGFISAGAGAVLFLMPLSIPADEFTRPGVFMLVLGILSMFVLPQFPYYKVAVLWGGLCLFIGLYGLGDPSETAGEMTDREER